MFFMNSSDLKDKTHWSVSQKHIIENVLYNSFLRSVPYSMMNIVYVSVLDK